MRPRILSWLQTLKLVVSIQMVVVVGPISAIAAPPDKQAPTQPTDLVASTISTSGFTAVWAASTDNIGVTGYEVFLGGVTQGLVTTTSKVFTGLQSGAAYSVTVRARDAAGNWSIMSAALPVTTSADNVSPTAPASLTSTGVTASGFTINWSASTDNVGVTAYEIYIGGVSQGTVAATSKTVTGLQPETTYNITVRAQDAAVNWSAQSAALTVTTTTDTTAPSIPTGLTGSAVSSSGFTLSWTASSDNVGVTAYEVFLGAVSQGMVTTVSKVFTGLQPSTTYSVSIRARDGTGNWSSQSGSLAVTTSSAVSANQAISVGYGHVNVLKADGTVWGWGDNTCDGTMRGNVVVGTYKSPIQVPDITTATAVAAGGYHTLVLKQDGTVLAFGYGPDGALGGGSGTVPIPRFTGVKSLAAGFAHSLAVKTDGTIYGWGNNASGQVGNNKTTNVAAPVQLSKITGVVQAAAGSAHSLALKSDGTVLAWGNNFSGQLGNGTNLNQLAPIAISGFSGVTQIVAAGTSSYALKADRTVWAWGLNSAGQLGDGTTVSRNRPTQVTGLTGVVAISSGGTHVLALKSDGSIWSWGRNASRQLGEGSEVDRLNPVRVTTVNTAVKIAAGENVSYAVLADGTIRSWGDYLTGMLGDGGSGVVASPFDDVAQMYEGWTGDILVVRKNGTVWGWGPNSTGALGDSSKRRYDAPVQIAGLNGITQVSQTIALKGDGTVWTWGMNNTGQLGDGTTLDRFTPAQVSGLAGVIRVACGSRGNGAHCMALKSDGTVWTWGDNQYGQLGDGTLVQKNTPTQVPGLTGITWITAGGPNSFAVKSDGTSWAWGYDYYVFGAGTGVSTSVPIRTLVNNVSKIETEGRSRTLFLTQFGSVYICGNSDLSAYGGNWFGSNYPLLVSGVSSLVEVATPLLDHGVTRTSDGSIWNLGDNGPELATNISNPLQIKSSPGFGLVYQDGTAVLWSAPLLRPVGFSNLASQVADFRLGSSNLDSDGDGLPDSWEMQMFGNLGHAAATDDDQDGLTNIQEFLRNTNPIRSSSDGDGFVDSVDMYPSDYYNGSPPVLAILGGNNQLTPVDQFNAAPFDVAIWRADGSTPFVNAPVTFTISSGAGGALALDRPGSSPLSNSLSLLTDAEGTAQVFYKQPTEAGILGRIVAAAGAAQVTFETTSSLVGDSDGDGLVDAWEQRYFGTLNYGGGDDPGAVGRPLIQSFQQAQNPWPAPDVASGLRAWFSASLGIKKDSAGYVSQWSDLSGTGNHVAEKTPAQNPTWSPADANGKAVVQFVGSQQLLSLVAVDVEAGSNDVTIVAVIRPTAGQNAGAEILTYGGDSLAGTGLIAETATRFGLHWFDVGGGEQRSPSVAVATGQTQILTVVKEAAAASTFRNGLLVGSAAVPNLTAIALGKIALGQNLNGQIAEVLVYNRALTGPERAQLEEQLATYYSVVVGTVPDADGDGLSDAQEDLLGTNKVSPDHPDVDLQVLLPAKHVTTP